MTVCMIFMQAAFDTRTDTAAEGTVPPAESESAEWTRRGYYLDEENNFLSVNRMDDTVEPGWYVSIMIGDIMTGWTIPQDGNTLHRDLNVWNEDAEPYIVTISEEGGDGLRLSVDGGGIYHFKPMDIPEATIIVSVNTEGPGNITYAEGEAAPEIDPDYPYQSVQINLAEPAAHTLAAWPQADSVFVKWTKNGEDLSTEPQFTVLLDESAEFIAVFEEDPDWQNPVMNYIGEYQSGRAHALVECSGREDARITIDWAGSARDAAHWDITGRPDPDMRTIHYSGCKKSILVYGSSGEVVSRESEYDDGTGTVVFNDDGTFTWHEDQPGSGQDMVFEWLPVRGGLDYGDPDNWAYFRMGEDRDADVFLICPTVDIRSAANALDINDDFKVIFDLALDMEKGIYEETGRMYAPYYRQMSIKAYTLPAAEMEEAKQFAYTDISDAFRWYLDNENDGRGIILAGFSQGSQMCLELLKEYFGGDSPEAQSLRDRLIAAYAIGWSITEEMVSEYPQIVPASGETDTGTVISFECEDGNLTGSIIIPAGVKALSINPLNWKTDATPADRSLNHGAVMKNGAGPIPGFCGAYIGDRGQLIVTDVTPADYPPVLDLLPEGSYHLYDYMFFFTNLKENVAARTAAWLAAHGRE